TRWPILCRNAIGRLGTTVPTRPPGPRSPRERPPGITGGLCVLQEEEPAMIAERVAPPTLDRPQRLHAPRPLRRFPPGPPASPPPAPTRSRALRGPTVPPSAASSSPGPGAATVSAARRKATNEGYCPSAADPGRRAGPHPHRLVVQRDQPGDGA